MTEALAPHGVLDTARALVDNGEPDHAEQLLLNAWIELLVDGHVTQTDMVLARLPDALADDPEVLSVRACCARLRGDREGARLLIARARARRTGSPESPFYALFLEDDERRLRDAALHTLAAIEDGSLRGRSHAYAVYLVGWTLLRLRTDPVRAHELLEAARADANARGLDVLASRASSNRAFALAFAGQLRSAADMLAATPRYEQGPWRMYDGGIEGVTAGYIAYWRGDIDGARTALQHVITVESDAPYAHLARVYNAFIAARVGGTDARARAYLELRRIPDATLLGVPWPIWRAAAECLLARTSGRRDTAQRLAHLIVATDAVPVARALAADVLRWSGDHRAAHDALEDLQPNKSPGYLTALVEVTRALMAYEAGAANAAHIRLERALDAAEPEFACMPFLTDAAGADELFASHAAWGSNHESLIGACLDRRAAIAHPRDGQLSPREQQVLTYLRTTLTTAEIAGALHVSINTVKTHTQSLYRKLGVSNRREAVRYRR